MKDRNAMRKTKFKYLKKRKKAGKLMIISEQQKKCRTLLSYLVLHESVILHYEISYV
jgi:hypothetical protein